MLQSTIHQLMKLSDDSGLFYKAYCQDGLSREPKVKKFMVDKDVTTNYLYLRSKLMEVFPVLKTVSDFTIHWLDNEGDKIEIGSDEELVIALSEQIDLNVKKLYISVPQAVKSSDLSGPVHEGVECDGCNGKVSGFRYKCISCVDFDLCESCETQRLHPDHFMLRVPVPTTLTGHCLGRKLGKRLHRYSRRQECRGGGGYKPKENGEEGNRGNKETEPDQGTDWVENLFKVICQFGQTGLNHAAALSQVPHPSTSTEQNLQNTLQNLKQNFANFVDPLGFLPPSTQSSNKATGTPMETETLTKTPEPEVILIDTPSTSTAIPQAQQESQPPQQATNSQQTSPTERSWILVEPNQPNKLNEEVLTPTIAPEQRPSQEPRPATSSQDQRPTTSQQDQRPIGFNLPIHPADDNVSQALEKMLSMGFNNEGDWLRQMLASKQGNIEEVLDMLMPIRKFTPK